MDIFWSSYLNYYKISELGLKKIILSLLKEISFG